MKKLTRSVISFILLLAICISMLSTALAADSSQFDEANYVYTEVTNYIREASNSLSPEAKQIFLNSIASDHELLTYYQENIDPSYTPKILTRAVSSADPLSDLKRDLNRLSLPNPVIVALLGVAATLAPATVEGPIPVAKISLAFAVAGAAAVLAAHWSVVGPNFPNITKAFQKFLVGSVASVQQAFQGLKENILKIVGASTTSTISYDTKKKTVTYNGVTYHCKTKASELSNKKRDENTYYVTLRIGKMLYCDMDRPISKKVAEEILLCNKSSVGTMAMSSVKAKEVASPYLRRDPIHKPGGPGYFPHYHPKKAQNAHSWYLIK